MVYVFQDGPYAIKINDGKFPGRSAYIYKIMTQSATPWRIRLHKYPEEPGWAGGRVIWGLDKEFQIESFEIIRDWIEGGSLPEGVSLL